MSFTYIVREDFLAGIPQTVLAGGAGPWRAIVGHWSVGRPGFAGWMGTVNDVLIPSGRPGGRNVSYHEGWCWDAGTRTFTASRIVRPNRAAHSMKPIKPPAGPWDPDSVARELLGDKAHDPNRFTYAICFAGGPDHLEAAEKDADFVAACARRFNEIRKELPSLPAKPIFEHRRGQNNKRDWGNTLTARIYAVAAGAVVPPVTEDDMAQFNVMTGKLLSLPRESVLYVTPTKARGATEEERADPKNVIILGEPLPRELPLLGEFPDGVRVVAYRAEGTTVPHSYYSRPTVGTVKDVGAGATDAGADVEALVRQAVNGAVDRIRDALPAVLDAARR